ncbi:MAG: CDP-alcohol phosphatidyltransferase family protein [Clostridiales bacterium]|jgi:CDP-diacylglycerol--glycerol-3-phosphate 3-phosphatidyltransferase|nr:CDP-alcohol phosphatidyltransferase family protein [Clostridiales bacterium]
MVQTCPSEASSGKIRLLNAVPQKLIRGIHASLDRLADFLTGFHTSPNIITVLGLLAGLASGLLFAIDRPLGAAGLIIICGLLDILDGKVATRGKRQSLYGAIFDSTLDRYSEFFIYLGLAVHFRNRWPLWVVFLTFLGSTMVSYTRARAEGLGIECREGLMQRAERLILLVLGSLIGSLLKAFDPVMTAVLIFIALVSNITAFQRTFLVKKVEKNLKTHKEV